MKMHENSSKEDFFEQNLPCIFKSNATVEDYVKAETTSSRLKSIFTKFPNILYWKVTNGTPRQKNKLESMR